MKKDIHPKEYRFVVFKDISNDYSFITRSTAQTKDTAVWEDGKEYPLVKLDISHTSHPFFTGKMKFVDTAGRVDKFRTKYKRHISKKEETPAETNEETPAENNEETPAETNEETPQAE